jgi:hypothetical protein
VNFLTALKAKKVTEKLGPAVPDSFKADLEGFYSSDTAENASLLKELREKLRPENTKVGKVPKCNPCIYTTLGYTPGGPTRNREQRSAKGAQQRDAKFQNMGKSLMGLQALEIELMQHPDLPDIPDSVKAHMAEIFSAIAAIYGEMHSMRKQFLFEALPFHYREALKPIPTNLMGTLLFRQNDAELTKELQENNKRRKENLELTNANNRGASCSNRGNHRSRPYNSNNRPAYNRQYDNRQSDRYNNNNGRNNRDNDRDFHQGNRQSRPPQHKNNNRGGYNKK